MHLLLVRHLLDRLVVDLVHRLVGQGGLARVLQERFHQHLVVLEGEPALDVGAVVQLLLLGRLRQHDGVGEIGDEVFALLLRRHGRHVAADLLLGEGEIALADIDAVGAGNHWIGLLRPERGDRCDEERGDCERAERAAYEQASAGHGRSSFVTGANCRVPCSSKTWTLVGPGLSGLVASWVFAPVAQARIPTRTLAESPVLGNRRIDPRPHEHVDYAVALTRKPPPPICRRECGRQCRLA